MSLPDSWVDRIFAKLIVTYGQGFLRQYEGIELPLVKANWAVELSRFQQAPDAIRHGLECLPPSRAPTVLEFRDLCRKAPDFCFATLALPAPSSEADGTADPEAIAAALEKLRSSRPIDARHWAHSLKAREEGGQTLSFFQRQSWREALGHA